MPLATGEAPNQEGVDSPERELSCVGMLSGAGYILQDPAQLRTREIRIQYEPRAFLQPGFPPFVRRTELGCTAILPNNRTMHGPTCLAVPHQRRLTLVRDRDCRQVRRHHFGPF